MYIATPIKGLIFPKTKKNSTIVHTSFERLIIRTSVVLVRDTDEHGVPNADILVTNLMGGSWNQTN